MNISELRAKTVPQLEEELKQTLLALFKLRMQKGSGNTENTVKLHDFKRLRRYAARIKTIIHQKVTVL